MMRKAMALPGRPVVLFAVGVINLSLLIFLQGCCPGFEETSGPTILAPAELVAVSENVRQLTTKLDYPDKTAEDLAAMVNNWKDKHGTPILALWRHSLNDAKAGLNPNDTSSAQPAKIARIEEDITVKLYRRIQKEIGFDQNLFELADIVEHRQAQCLGYSQLLYILGNSIGLSVESTDVAEFRNGLPPPGLAHTANLVTLADGGMMMIDLTPPALISFPFRLQEQFTKLDGYWQLKDNANPSQLDKKFQILDVAGLAAHIYNNRAGAHIKSEQYTEALADLAVAIRLCPNYADAHLNRGLVCCNLGQFEEALSDYTRAIELKPRFAEAYNNRAVVYHKLGRLEMSVSDYSKAIELDPVFVQAYYNRANACGKLGWFTNAISDYTQAIRLNSNLADAYGNRGLAYAISDEPSAARKDLVRAAKLKPALKSYVKTVSDRFNLGLDTDKL